MFQAGRGNPFSAVRNVVSAGVADLKQDVREHPVAAAVVGAVAGAALGAAAIIASGGLAAPEVIAGEAALVEGAVGAEAAATVGAEAVGGMEAAGVEASEIGVGMSTSSAETSAATQAITQTVDNGVNAGSLSSGLMDNAGMFVRQAGTKVMQTAAVIGAANTFYGVYKAASGSSSSGSKVPVTVNNNYNVQNSISVINSGDASSSTDANANSSSISAGSQAVPSSQGDNAGYAPATDSSVGDDEAFQDTSQGGDTVVEEDEGGYTVPQASSPLRASLPDQWAAIRDEQRQERAYQRGHKYVRPRPLGRSSGAKRMRL